MPPWTRVARGRLRLDPGGLDDRAVNGRGWRRMAADGGSLAARTDLKDARGLRGHPILVNAIAIAGTPWLMLAKMDQDNAHAGI